MACAKPIDPASMTPPEDPRHPDEPRASELLRELTLFAKYAEPGTSLDDTLARAEFIIEQARQCGVAGAEMDKLQRQLDGLKAEATRLARESLHTSFSLLRGRETYASKANIEMVSRAMTDDRHWAAEEMRANLQAIIERNGRIPAAYKPRLHHDLAVVLRACPHAGGLVKELTLRGQRGATASPSKLGSNANAAVGAAYELMGTAALATKGSKARNPGAPPLFIRPGEDHVAFGPKTYLNGSLDKSDRWLSPDRSRIECDVRIGRSTIDGVREIGIDFKHSAKGTTYSSAKLVSQAKAVAEAIKSGQLHEYHFVTNGRFGGSFPDTIAEINADLVGRGYTAIGLHERVTTLGTDANAGTLGT